MNTEYEFKARAEAYANALPVLKELRLHRGELTPQQISTIKGRRLPVTSTARSRDWRAC